jgi:hypothetical protein
MMELNPPEVRDRETATRFVRWCVEQLGLGYHPDTRFADYVEEDGRPAFTPAQALQLDELTEKAFAFIDPYEVGMAEFKKLMGQGAGDVP